MNRTLFLLLFFIPFVTFGNIYEDALKLDAKGKREESIEKFKEYFNLNINQDNQDSIIEKLFYASTLFESIDSSLNFLIGYAKFMKNPNSRYIVYRKIAEVNELRGNIVLAGKYYEKAAYTLDAAIDYHSYFDSLALLLEVGYFNKAVLKLEKIDKAKLEEDEIERFYYLLSLSYFLNGDKKTSKEYLKYINKKDSRYWYLYSKLNNKIKGNSSFNKSIEYFILKNRYNKLRTPTDYIGIENSLPPVSSVPFNSGDDTELFVGLYKEKTFGAGTVNILEQLNLKWYFDKVKNGYALYAFTDDKHNTVRKLKKLGITIKDRSILNE